MTCSDSGGISKRVVAIQVVFLVVIAGVFAFVKIYSPRMEKAREARQQAERESRITDFFNSMVAKDSGRLVETPRGQMHPQTLRGTPSVDEMQQTLGAADKSTTDFAGGLHLTWDGTSHTLEGAFTRGKLYCLSMKDNSTGHGESVYESVANWRAF